MSIFNILDPSRTYFGQEFILKPRRNFGEQLQTSRALSAETGLRIIT
jgi:hypothetical protein